MGVKTFFDRPCPTCGKKEHNYSGYMVMGLHHCPQAADAPKPPENDMIFTLGHAESYLRYFLEQGHPKKMGKSNPDCEGEAGTVFHTFAEADAIRPETHAVFGVKANWEEDTATRPNGGPGNELLRDADLVILRSKSMKAEYEAVIKDQ